MADNEDLEDKGPVTEPDDNDSEPEDKPELPQEPLDKNADIEVPLTRTEKKRNRVKEFEERTTRAEQAAESARREAQEARELYQRQLQHPQSQQHQPQVNPTQHRLQQIQNLKAELHEQYQLVASQPGYDPRGKDRDRQRDFETKAEQLENARVAAITQAQQPQFNEQDLIRKVALHNYLNSHSDVTHDPKAWEWAHARWVQRKAEGQPDTIEMADDVMEEARIKFGKPTRKSRGRVDHATKARLSGIASQSAGAAPEVGMVKMNAMERKMAREMYDKLPPEQAYQKWANGPGKRAAAKRTVSR
jgi:hypothetical protein